MTWFSSCQNSKALVKTEALVFSIIITSVGLADRGLVIGRSDNIDIIVTFIIGATGHGQRAKENGDQQK